MKRFLRTPSVTKTKMAASKADIEYILEFWIGPAAHDAIASSKRNALWYRSNPKADDIIRGQFGKLLSVAEANGPDDKHWQATGRGSLALVILLDQFSRNIYRGTAQAFKNDEHALQSTLFAIDQKQDLHLACIERIFLYHPLHHCESLANQDRAVELFSLLERTAPRQWRKQMGRFVHYAELHRDIVRTFGRFPHRNSLLGRENTRQEQVYLDEHNHRFGQ